MFKINKLYKKFLNTLSEEGLGVAFWRTVRKVFRFVTRNLSVFRRGMESQEMNLTTLEIPYPIVINTISEDEFPVVSIIIPIYNNFLYTFNCLKSISQVLDGSLPYEVIVVDDASTDETEQVLQLITGIRIFINHVNSGFIQSCNLGATMAKGHYLYFLNNDTQILSNSLESMVGVIEKDSSVGAVGSKLLYNNGRLQEAGGIIWQDASGWNYGRLQNPEEPEYNYLREVDYCSGASLLVRSDLFEKLGGFSREFLPAYYEDTDLCFALRNLGYKVIYQPQSRVVHYEGITSGTDIKSGVKQYQEVNKTRFETKWRDVLANHLPSDASYVPQGARRLQSKPTILVIDSYVPLYDRESGCVRLLGILKIFLELGYSVIFLPDNGTPEEPYTSTLQSMGIEVLYHTQAQPDLSQQLLERLALVDFIWLCRPELCDKYLELIRHHSEIPIIYDTIDLHFLRLKRQEHYLSKDYQNTTWSWPVYQKLETKFAQAADATVVVTDVEKKTLEELGIDNICIIPNIHNLTCQNFNDFEQRSGLVFIGSYNHPPNIDAVIWLCQEIMPIVWESHPEICLTLLGSNVKDEVKALASEKVIVTGYVLEVDPYFIKNRVFVSPLRFGAGMKGKIGQSMSYGLPVVTTSIGAEGMGLKDSYDVLIADDPRSLASSIIKLYYDRELWVRISQNSLETIEQYSPEKVKSKLSQLFARLSAKVVMGENK
jgi:GT2 family glycosyltransferase/glycosyltransferase involved in cell wall biosynthesis